MLNRATLGAELEASVDALHRTLLSRFTSAAEAVQRLRPEGSGIEATGTGAAASAATSAGGASEGSPGGRSDAASDGVVVRMPSSVASLNDDNASLAGLGGEDSSPNSGLPQKPSGTKSGSSKDLMEIDEAEPQQLPADLISALGMGLQVAIVGLRGVEPGRLRERMLQMLPHMFKLQELAGAHQELGLRDICSYFWLEPILCEKAIDKPPIDICSELQ